MVAQHVRRGHLAPEPRRPRPAQGLRGLRRGGEAQGPADGDPRQDRQGLRHGRGGRRQEHRAPAEEDADRGAEAVPRPLQHPDRRRQARRPALLQAGGRLAGDEVHPGAARAALGGSLPQRRAQERQARGAEARDLQAAARGHGRGPRDLHHDGVRAHAHRAREGQGASARTWCPSCPTSRAPSAWRGSSASSASTPRSASSTSRRTPTSSCSTRRTRTARSSRKASTRPGAMCSWMAAATSYSNNNVPMIPFYIFYSMFGMQRVGDLAWAAGDMRTRGFLIGGTAGRTTLNGEGLQHEDGHSHVLAATIPNCVSYDPTFAYEVAVIVQDGLRRMVEDQEDVFYYITVMNENYAHPALPEGAREGILKGMYKLSDGGEAQGPARAAAGQRRDPARGDRGGRAAEEGLGRHLRRVELPELQRAAPRRHRGRRAGTCCIRPRSARASYVEQCLAGTKGPVIASTDYMRTFADQIREFVPRRYKVLGTDGFGRSDSRENLRRFFEVNRYYVVVAALKALAEDGEVPAAKVAEAIKKYGIDAEQARALDGLSGSRRRTRTDEENALAAIEVKVPDIGDFKDIPVIELLVKPGDAVKKDDSLRHAREPTRRRWKCPRRVAGVVKDLKVKVGDKVSEGTPHPHARWRSARPPRRRPSPHPPRRPPPRRSRSPAPAPAAKAAAAAPRRDARSQPQARRRRLRLGRLRCRRSRLAARRTRPTRAPACAASRASSASTSSRVKGIGPEGAHPQGRHPEFREERARRRRGSARRRRQGRRSRRPGPAGVAEGGLRQVRPGRGEAALAHPEDLRARARAQLGDDPARHAVRRGGHHRARGLPRQGERGEREGRHQGDAARLPDEGGGRGAEEISRRSTARSTARTSS